MSDREFRCLVTGATGYIGGRLAPRLLDKGYAVRAMARRPDKLAGVAWRDRVEVVRGDLAEPDSLAAALDGVDVLYYLVHSMGTSRDFVAEEARSAGNLVAAARRAGVRRLVYLSGLHPSGADLSPHLRSRKAVGETILQSGIETVVLQAGIVVGSGSASFEMIRHLTDRLPAMTAPKWVHNRIQPIAIDDVLHYLTEAATTPLPAWYRVVELPSSPALCWRPASEPSAAPVTTCTAAPCARSRPVPPPTSRCSSRTRQPAGPARRSAVAPRAWFPGASSVGRAGGTP